MIVSFTTLDMIEGGECSYYLAIDASMSSAS